MNHRRPLSLWTICLAASLLAACGADDAADAADSGAAAAGGGAGGEGTAGGEDGVQGGAGGTAQDPDAGLPTGNFPQNGLWFVTVDVVELAYKLPLQLEIQGTEATRTLDTVTLRAVGSDGTSVSDPLVELNDIAVAADGHFLLAFENVTLPGAYTVTGSDVVVTVTLEGNVTGTDTMCGTVRGQVVTLELVLEASNFGAIPWEAPASQRSGSCEPPVVEMLTPIDPMDCPALVAGENAGFPSAGKERTFRLFVPATWSADRKWPVIFLWHGLGQPQDEIQMNSAMETYVDDREFLLVVPDSQAIDKPGVEWDQLGVGENADLVFFDDLLTCLDKSHGVDPDRVHSTGLSAGGLWTTYLTMFRSEKIASSVAFSGGLLVDYPMPAARRPMIEAWGGVEDIAFMQNFDTLAHDLIGDLLPNGHFVVACNHGRKHVWEPDFTPWALDFLFAHPRGVDPEPYVSGLPETFPDFCEIATP